MDYGNATVCNHALVGVCVCVCFLILGVPKNEANFYQSNARSAVLTVRNRTTILGKNYAFSETLRCQAQCSVQAGLSAGRTATLSSETELLKKSFLCVTRRIRPKKSDARAARG